jgi:prophage regulatory protein
MKFYLRVFCISMHGRRAGLHTRAMFTPDRNPTSQATSTNKLSQPKPDSRQTTRPTTHSDVNTATPRLISLAEVMERVALGRTSIYQLIKTHEFPAPVKIQRAARWVDIEISEWIWAQMSKRYGPSTEPAGLFRVAAGRVRDDAAAA